MAFRYSTELRNAGLDARIAAIGPSPVLKIFAGGLPHGTELVSIPLPKQWMSKAEDGVATSTEEWQSKASGDGKAKSFRIYSGGVCHIEGAIPDDMKLDNTNIATGQTVTISAFTIRSGNG